MMSDEDCKDLEKTLNTLKRGPNDLEAIIETLKFRNEKLHKFNKRVTGELIKERKERKALEKKIMEMLSQYRNKGEL
jgi:predicted  nucleic acid-binding Zn-ribbon protein